MYSSTDRKHGRLMCDVVVPPEAAEEVERVAPTVERHRDAEPPVEQPRHVDHPRDEHGDGGERELRRGVPVAVQGEQHRADHEADPEEVQRIAEDRMPVAQEDLRERLMHPRVARCPLGADGHALTLSRVPAATPA
jgi:hypothetical protein